MIIKNARIYTPEHTFKTGDLTIRDGRIAFGAPPLEGEEVLDANGAYALPGLVDIHFHGAVGHDFCDADEAGLQPGDRIVAVGGKQVATWNDMVLEINSYGEKEVVLSAERNGVTRDYTLKPEYDKYYGKPLVGISPQIEHKSFSIFESLKMGFKYTEYITLMMLDGLYKIVTGAAPADVTGPIGIAKIAGEAAENGWMPLLNLTALLSINLGIINLLPLPALDGGHFVLLILEALRGKPLGEKAATMIQSIGVGLILTLTGWAVFSDISR